MTVIGGFLGAGKTTLLNRVLDGTRDRRLAVVVNDFGSIEIDPDLVQSTSGETISLANGCVCCTIGGELLITLAGLRDRDDPPEHVVIEASGVADPAAIAAYGDVPGFERDGTIVVVDAETVRERADDAATGSQVEHQLRSGHLLVLNKSDLVEPDALADTRAWLRRTAPYAGVVEASYGDVPAALLLGATGEGRPANQGDAHDHEAAWASWSWAGEPPLNGTALTEALPELPEGILRGKGFLHLREDPSNRYLLQLVGRTWQIHSVGPWGQETPGSRLVLIGLSDSIRPDELEAMVEGLTAG
jgi:G3E family GTPase